MNRENLGTFSYGASFGSTGAATLYYLGAMVFLLKGNHESYQIAMKNVMGALIISGFFLGFALLQRQMRIKELMNKDVAKIFAAGFLGGLAAGLAYSYVQSGLLNLFSSANNYEAPLQSTPTPY